MQFRVLKRNFLGGIQESKFTLNNLKRKVVFKPKHQGPDDDAKITQELEADHNSLYVMSRASQNWFSHGVPPVSADQDIDERFSITFRTLKKKFKRSIVLVGDSNTRDVNFGAGSGKVGASFPGKRVQAAKVKDINPHACIGYSNIFFMCGTNDLRTENINSESDVHRLVDQLKERLIETKQLCPQAKVFVIPVLPSRIPRMNSNIRLYNELVDHMLFTNFPDIWFQGIYNFVDAEGLLSHRLTRTNDKIHLSPRGVAKLVTYIKTWVFKREKFDNRNHLNQESAPKVGSPEPT